MSANSCDIRLNSLPPYSTIPLTLWAVWMHSICRKPWLSKLSMYTKHADWPFSPTGASRTSWGRSPRTQGCPFRASPASVNTPRGRTAWSPCSNTSRCPTWACSSSWSSCPARPQSMVGTGRFLSVGTCLFTFSSQKVHVWDFLVLLLVGL